MRDIDFIRQLIDFIDARRDSIEVEPVQPTAPVQAPVTKIIHVVVDKNADDHEEQYDDEQVDQEEVENPMDRDDLFIPPLQAKLEIMKKMAGIEPKNQELIASDDDEPIDG